MVGGMWRPISRFFQALESHWTLYGMVLRWLATVGGGVVSAWTAGATETLQTYAPFSWVAAGLLGSLAVAWILGGIAWFRTQLLQATYLRQATKRPSDINPLANEFNSERIRLSDIASPIDGAITGKTFTRCELLGPANVVFSGCEITRNDFYRHDIVLCAPNAKITNAILFQDCTIARCKLDNVTIYLSPEAIYDDFQSDMANWITPSPA